MESQSDEIWWSYTWDHVIEAEAFIHSINDELESIDRVPMTADPGYPESSRFHIMSHTVQRAMSVIALGFATERIKKDLIAYKVRENLDNLHREVADLGINSHSGKSVWELREKYQKIIDKNSVPSHKHSSENAHLMSLSGSM